MILRIRRLLAIWIDYVIIFYTCFYAGKIIEPLTFKNIFLEIVFSIAFLLIFFTIFIRKDSIFGYESIGKKIMCLKIYDLNGQRVTEKKKLIDRTFYTTPFFCLYPIMVLINNQSIGDRKIGTQVK